MKKEHILLSEIAFSIAWIICLFGTAVLKTTANEAYTWLPKIVFTVMFVAIWIFNPTYYFAIFMTFGWLLISVLVYRNTRKQSM